MTTAMKFGIWNKRPGVEGVMQTMVMPVAGGYVVDNSAGSALAFVPDAQHQTWAVDAETMPEALRSRKSAYVFETHVHSVDGTGNPYISYDHMLGMYHLVGYRVRVSVEVIE